MKKTSEDEHTSLTFSYLALRKIVVWIGILLPIVLTLVTFGISWLTKGGTLYFDKRQLTSGMN